MPKQIRLNHILAAMVITVASLLQFTGNAANIVVRNFKMEPTDQTAINRETMKKDQNGNTAALIKIYTTLNVNETFFDNGVMGVVARINKPGQIWLYIPERSSSLQIMNTKYSPMIYPFDDEILAGRTYSMELTVEGKEVTLSASVRQSTLFVDGDSVGLSPQNIYLSYGEHSVRAEKGSMLYDGNVMVTADGPSRFELPMEDESLKYSDVTVRVPGNADIYFQGDKVGVGEWKSRLKGGRYSVEIRKANCEDRVVNFEATPGSPVLVECPAPEPYKGFLNVDVVPNTGVKIMDGDTLVAEHSLSKHLRIGNYSYTFRKKGYLPVTKTFTVRRNESTSDTVSLQRIQYIRRNAIYVGAGFTYGTIYGVGLHLGGVFSNINLEIGYTLGLGKSGTVYWYADPNPGGLYKNNCTYSMDEIEAKAGYQFSFVERIGLTPQIGYLGQRLRGGTYGNGAMCHNASVGLRFVFNPIPRVGVFVNPRYAVPVMVNDLYKEIAEIGDFSKGGLYVSGGVTFNF